MRHIPQEMRVLVDTCVDAHMHELSILACCVGVSMHRARSLSDQGSLQPSSMLAWMHFRVAVLVQKKICLYTKDLRIPVMHALQSEHKRGTGITWNAKSGASGTSSDDEEVVWLVERDTICGDTRHLLVPGVDRPCPCGQVVVQRQAERWLDVPHRQRNGPELQRAYSCAGQQGCKHLRTAEC